MRHNAGRGRRRSVIASVAAAALAISGLIALGIGLLGQSGRPPADAAATSASATSPSSSGPKQPALSATRVTIPAIGADSSLAQLGLADGSTNIELPPRVAQAGWYTKSPVPGEAGATIITGYISDGGAAGPFNDLKDLSAQDEILVGRSDGKTVTFTVSKITTYSSGQFNADQVYAPTTDPELRIITVGGALHSGDGAENVVVFAKMTSIDDTRVSAPTFHPASQPTSLTPSAPTPAASQTASHSAHDGMVKSPPKTLRIPSIGVDSPVDTVGLAADKKTMELPPHADRAAWYDQSLTPGQAGVSIIAGHVRSTGDKPGVFANIAKLKAGATISVERADKTVATFRVTKSTFYPDGKFPAKEVYTPSTAPELNMITIGGPFGPGGAKGNYVVFATLAGSSGAAQ